jgi:hypothetical protein
MKQHVRRIRNRDVFDYVRGLIDGGATVTTVCHLSDNEYLVVFVESR